MVQKSGNSVSVPILIYDVFVLDKTIPAAGEMRMLAELPVKFKKLQTKPKHSTHTKCFLLYFK